MYRAWYFRLFQSSIGKYPVPINLAPSTCSGTDLKVHISAQKKIAAIPQVCL